MKNQEAGLTLTKAVKISKNVLKYGSIGIVTILFARFLLNTSITIYKNLNPPPPPPPTVGFGKLPALAFPDRETKPQEYRLETATGKLPSFEDRAKVFFIPETAPSLLTDQAVKEIAQNLGFTGQPSILDARTYRWSKNIPLISTITIDALDNTFTMYTDFLTRPELLIDAQLPDDFEGVATLKNFISRAGLLHSDIATVSGSIEYLKSLGTTLEPALSYSDAEFMRVDIFRRPIDQLYPMVTENGRGTVSALIAGALGGEQSIVEIEYKHRAIDYIDTETYPLRSVSDAWQLVQANEGYVINPQEVSEVVVREVTLGYYDSLEPQAYLQPVYIFSGDEDVVIIVSAVDPVYIERNPN